jgi:hypothetical protein
MTLLTSTTFLHHPVVVLDVILWVESMVLLVVAIIVKQIVMVPSNEYFGNGYVWIVHRWVQHLRFDCGYPGVRENCERQFLNT